MTAVTSLIMNIH